MPLLDRLRPFVFRGIIHGGSFLLTHGACDRMLRDPRSGQILMHGNAAVQAVGAWVAGLPFQQALKLKQTGMDGKTSLISVTILFYRE